MEGLNGARLLAAALASAVVIGVALFPAGSEAAVGQGASRAEVPAPKTKWDPIPYDRARKRQMAGYSKRHYGQREWRLDDPRAIVLHYTAGSSYESAFNTFASNAPNNGELPGVCTQFVVDKDGTIYQLTRLYVRCRHTIGLNHVAIGIEMVQEDAGGSHATSQAILDRKAQAKAAVRLAAWLRTRYRIGSRDLIGHAMANDSPYFKDKQGWRNDHTDWPKAEVKTFRKRVIRVIREHKREPAGARRASSRVVFGHSVAGRKLTARRLGDARSERTALIVGQVDGDEEAGRAVIRRLRRHPGRLSGIDAWTVATMNPDGHADDRRTNERGVDLNRNFGVGWSGAEPEGSGYYAGRHPFSEPESKAIRRLIRRIDPDLTIYYHQPWGAVLLPCDGPAAAQKRYARISGLPAQRCRGQNLPGTAVRWQNRRGGTNFVVELEAGGLSDAEVRRHARAAARVAAG